MKATVRVSLRVAPGSARAAVVGRHGGGWKVRVAAAPERGRANEAVVALLAETLELSRRDVAILSGHASRDKVVALAGIEQHAVEERLTAAAVAS